MYVPSDFVIAISCLFNVTLAPLNGSPSFDFKTFPDILKPTTYFKLEKMSTEKPLIYTSKTSGNIVLPCFTSN